MKRHLISGLLAIAATAGLPAAADTALLIGNSSYYHARDLSNTRALRLAENPLREAGFSVIQGANVETDDIREGMARLADSGEDQRILITLIGHFAHSADGETWFLGTEADRPNRGDVGGQGIALSTVMALAAQAPGRAVVLLGYEDRAIGLGTGLSAGILLPDPPQGVTLAMGAPREVTNLTRQTLLRPGQSVAEALASAEVEATGFISDAIAFQPAAEPTPERPAPVATDPEQELWDAVQELNTEGAYTSYLRQYPTGRFAAEARAAFEALRDPLRLAAEAEAALELTRADRRSIQADLTVLGHDTNGVDGIFGNGTRGAIRSWQRLVGFEETGHMTADAIALLGQQAADRRAQIEAEEAVARSERERLDRAYWAATGRGQDEVGLRAYLNRYPDGLFADLAQARLEEIDAIRAAEAAAAEEDAWDFAERQGNLRGYQGYLTAYPNGQYVQEARNRIAELRGEPLPFPDQDDAALLARENAMNLPTITRMLIERRLQGSGYNPGTPDGRFDDQTRVALRAFQTDAGLPATGYVDDDTLRRFLADGIQVIIR